MDANVTAQKAPAEALRLARSALRTHPECFWMRSPTAPLEEVADVKLIIRRLRENGGRPAWQAAREIELCL